MAEASLEQRVADLEKKVADLSARPANGTHEPAWLQTVGMFANDPIMLEIFQEAMRIREADRKKTRQRKKRAVRVKS